MDALTTYRHAGDQVVVVTGAPFELVRTSDVQPEAAGAQVGDHVAVQGGLMIEVEVFQRFTCRESGRADADRRTGGFAGTGYAGAPIACASCCGA